jgi:hypothetical protein
MRYEGTVSGSRPIATYGNSACRYGSITLQMAAGAVQHSLLSLGWHGTAPPQYRFGREGLLDWLIPGKCFRHFDLPGGRAMDNGSFLSLGLSNA